LREQRLDPPHGVIVPADHDEQVSRARPRDPAGDGRVHEIDVARGQPIRPALDRPGTDGGHDEHGGAGLERCARRVPTEEHVLDLIGRRHHQDEDIDAGSDLGDRRGGRDAVGDELLGAARVDGRPAWTP
jgi:hypothetical protein